MSKNIQLTLACGNYEITRPLKEGTVKPVGIDLTIIDNMDSATRHWRFLRNKEFDVAEFSSAGYVMAKARGNPIQAIPVFLHRRFRHGFVFVNTSKGITKPSDLIGKKIGCKFFLVSAVHWLRGILEHEYGVPHTSIEWYTELDEDVDFTPPPGLKFHRLRDDQSVEDMLLTGELDAYLSPDVIKPIADKDPRVARLFPNYKEEEKAYFQRTGIFPIMHVMSLKPEVTEKYPWAPIALYEAFEEAKAVAMKKMRNPRLVPLAWYQEAWEEEREVLGPDPWEYGLTPGNRKNLETYMDYFVEQGLIPKRLSLDELFLSMSTGHKRGAAYRDRV